MAAGGHAYYDLLLLSIIPVSQGSKLPLTDRLQKAGIAGSRTIQL